MALLRTADESKGLQTSVTMSTKTCNKCLDQCLYPGNITAMLSIKLFVEISSVYNSIDIPSHPKMTLEIKKISGKWSNTFSIYSQKLGPIQVQFFSQ